jgi:hypothetical protein
MTTITNRVDQLHDPLVGKMHDFFSGRVGQNVSTPLSTVQQWKEARPGSIHLYEDTQGAKMYMKAEKSAAGAAAEWATPIGVLQETVSYSDFTDGGAAVGTYTFTDALPAGARVLGCEYKAITGFTGDTSAVLTVGDGSTVDRYNTATPSIFATAAAGVDAGAVSGTAWNATAVSPVLTATSGSDWGLVTAGQVTVRIYYRE